MKILGIDVGGTGIKGAPVDCQRGKLLAERHRIETPKPPLPEAVVETIVKVTRHFRWKGPIGCTLPCVVKRGRILLAANLHDSWLNLQADDLLRRKLRSDVAVLNDADAAGIAEMRFGAGKGKRGLVAVVTLGTGIGTALFHDGRLVPNIELGHLIIRGNDSERRAEAGLIGAALAAAD
ncbi:MAG: hypothetical protein DCC75_13690 [Proteobacteria bacterium]|nr:MAG: hypothetical protein DCC75_13690 [Pseudomonadota bacterium]